MSKEKLIWKDGSGQDYYFDYEVNLNGNGREQKSQQQEKIVGRLKIRLLEVVHKTRTLLQRNGHVKEKDLVGADGLEPSTSRSQSAHSTN